MEMDVLIVLVSRYSVVAITSRLADNDFTFSNTSPLAYSRSKVDTTPDLNHSTLAPEEICDGITDISLEPETDSIASQEAERTPPDPTQAAAVMPPTIPLELDSLPPRDLHALFYSTGNVDTLET